MIHPDQDKHLETSKNLAVLVGL